MGITSILDGILFIVARQIAFAAHAKRVTHNGIWRAKIDIDVDVNCMVICLSKYIPDDY